MLFNSATKTYNTGFIKGIFHQLEFLEDLRDAGKSVEAIEKGITTVKVIRLLDIVADAGRKFELKNFVYYTGDNIKAVKKGLGKDIANVIANAVDEDDIIDGLSKIHIVFRGSPSGAGVW